MSHFAAPSMSRVSLSACVLIFMSTVACTSKQSSTTSAKDAASNHADASKAEQSQASNLPDPCKLLTKEEATLILGSQVKDPEPNSLGGNKICDFKTQKLFGGISPYWIHIAISPETQKVWEAGKKLHADAKESREVAGLGDDAYFLLDDLDVYSNQLSVTINVLKDVDKPSHSKTVQQAEKSVAEKILPRMKS
jgi:hypothetical protein